MREINLETWDRRTHFETFIRFDQPHFGMCANLDVTAFLGFVRQRASGFTASLVYVLARVANDVPAFRLRLRDGAVVEHDVVHPSITVLTEGDLFGFCSIEFDRRFETFTARARGAMEAAGAAPTLRDEPGRDDLLFMTAIPWVAFTSFMHPLPTRPADSFPRFAWGKRFEVGPRLAMPLGVQAHHALMDGFHVGQFYEGVQACLNDPGSLLEQP